MPASIRPLSPPHKGLRNALGLLSCYSGNCDYADLASVQRFRQCALDFHALCIDHEANEDRLPRERSARTIRHCNETNRTSYGQRFISCSLSSTQRLATLLRVMKA